MQRASATLIIATAIAVPIGGCGGAATDPNCQLVTDASYGPAGSAAFSIDEVVTGLEVPWGLAFLDADGLLISERPGRLQLYRDGSLTKLADVPISAGGEGGLLGLALAPDFADSRAFFVYFTTDVDGVAVNRVERWRLAEDEASASPEAVVVDGIPAAKFHNGGRIRIGPDGKLYIGTGDARVPELSQDVSSPAGKILRAELDGAVPSDNPFGNLTWMYGLRNTQGFDWLSGDTMVVSDHGPSGEISGRSDHDEISVAGPGANLGWPDIYACEARDGQISPSLTWSHAVPPGGLAIYRGDAITEWTGSVLVGSLGAEHLHRVSLADRTVTSHETYLSGASGRGRLREVIMGPDGHVYVTTSNCDGRGDCPASGDAVLRLRR